MREFFTSIQMLTIIRPMWLVVLLDGFTDFLAVVIVAFFYYFLFYVAGARDLDWAFRVAFSAAFIRRCLAIVWEIVQGIKRNRALSIRAQVEKEL